MKRDNAVLDKSKAFAIRIVGLYQFLKEKERFFPLAEQTLRSGTSIGANVREARRAQSTKDFLSKLYIALKESDETAYWLELLHETEYIDQNMFESLYNDCEELTKLLTAIIKTSKANEFLQVNQSE